MVWDHEVMSSSLITWTMIRILDREILTQKSKNETSTVDIRSREVLLDAKILIIIE